MLIFLMVPKASEIFIHAMILPQASLCDKQYFVETFSLFCHGHLFFRTCPHPFFLLFLIYYYFLFLEKGIFEKLAAREMREAVQQKYSEMTIFAMKIIITDRKRTR